MAITAIHPGEHLAEELKALDMSAAELARKNWCTYESRYTDLEWGACQYGRHGSAPRTFLRYERPVLTESLESL